MVKVLSALLPFPCVPLDPFWSSDVVAAREAVAAIATWRQAWSEWLRGERDDGISQGLATTLLEVLGELPTEGYRRYPYALTRFPDRAASEQDPTTALRIVLLWRAGLADFVADVWDTLGEADFGVEECQRIGALLVPPNAEDRCPLCLGSQTPSHFEACPVQREWRSRP